MPSRMLRLVVDAERHRAGEPPGDAFRHSHCSRARRRAAAAARHFDREARAAADIRFQCHLAIEHAGDAFDDRKAKADAARDARALVEAVELLEYGAPLCLRDADAGIADIDAQPRAAAPATDQHAARWRIFDRVRNEVLQQAPQQAPVRAHRERARHEDERQPLLARQRRKFHFQPLQQFVDAEIGDFRLHRAGVEPRNIQQRGEDLLHRLERRVDILHQFSVLAARWRSIRLVT